MRVGVLAHNQSLDTRARTHISVEVAKELVRRLVAEKITNRLIRMFPPESVFLAKREDHPFSNYIPEKLPPREVPGCRFRGPKPKKPHSIFFHATRFSPKRANRAALNRRAETVNSAAL